MSNKLYPEGERLLRRFDRPTPTEMSISKAREAGVMSLFEHGLAPEPVAVPSSDSIEAAFEAFHAANPWVYRSLVKLARDLHGRGRKKVGMKMLFEVLRWQWTMATLDQASDFKLNNNYTSRYARLIMENEDDLDGLFELRKLTS